MKFLVSIILASIVILTVSAPALAFTPPSQSTDNATDVILWPGGDIGIVMTTNGTVSIDGDVSIAGDVSVAGVEDGITEFFLLAVVALVIALAVWKHDNVFFRLIAAPVGVVYGLRLADTDSPGSTLWITGVVIAIIGLSFIYTPIVEEIKKRFGKKEGI